MTRQELSAFLQTWFCGCGDPEGACDALYRLLKLHSNRGLFDHRDEFKQLIPDDGMEMLVLYMLTHLDLTEHGGSVGGGWLTTDKGEPVLAALEREKADNYEALCVHRCMHGYAIDGPELADCPKCGPMNQH